MATTAAASRTAEFLFLIRAKGFMADNPSLQIFLCSPERVKKTNDYAGDSKTDFARLAASRRFRCGSTAAAKLPAHTLHHPCPGTKQLLRREPPGAAQPARRAPTCRLR